ncbi:MAG: aminotransferase class I/II-fold pyridoxal phosphate-dependent enzyme [bacterium]|nr:aminotransferase class I/II-fold pyridoxal phosphate-dependent enzyme [bacterium]
MNLLKGLNMGFTDSGNRLNLDVFAVEKTGNTRVSTSSNVAEEPRFPFSDYTNFLSELFKWQDQPGARIIAAGPVRPDVEIAADRAEIELNEISSESPFTVNISQLLKELQAGSGIFFLANPNRVTGANVSLEEIEEMVAAARGGLCIIDEFYCDGQAATALNLARQTNNLLVLRPVESPVGGRSNQLGLAAGSFETIEQLGRFMSNHQISGSQQQIMTAGQSDESTMRTRSDLVHSESIRISTTLSGIGIQCRLTPADFLLIRVAQPTQVANALTTAGVAIENLSGYPGLDQYLRYEIKSVRVSERLLNGFDRMPSDLYRIGAIDPRPIKLRRGAESAQTHAKERPAGRFRGKPVRKTTGAKTIKTSTTN